MNIEDLLNRASEPYGESTVAQTIKTIKSCQKYLELDSENVIDVYNNIDKILQKFSNLSSSTRTKSLCHLKRVYDLMSSEEKENISKDLSTIFGKNKKMLVNKSDDIDESVCGLDDDVDDTEELWLNQDKCAIYKLENGLKNLTTSIATLKEEHKQSEKKLDDSIGALKKEIDKLSLIVMKLVSSSSWEEGHKRVSEYCIEQIMKP